MPKIITPSTVLGKIHHNWNIKEYEEHERGIWWYVIAIMFTSFAIIYGVWSGNFLFALIIVLFSIIVYLQMHQKAPETYFAISELGIVIGEKIYTYNEFEEFYIIFNDEVKILILETKSLLRPKITIDLHDQEPIEIRHTLRAYLRENIEKEEEPATNALARRWKLH